MASSASIDEWHEINRTELLRLSIEICMSVRATMREVLGVTICLHMKLSYYVDHGRVYTGCCFQ